MIDVHLPTTDGRELLLTRYTQPEPELRLLIRQLKLQSAATAAAQYHLPTTLADIAVVQTFPANPLIRNGAAPNNPQIREDGLAAQPRAT